MQQNRVRQFSLYLKVLPQLWSFPLFWKCKLAKMVWPHLGWCIGPCGAGLAKQHRQACCSLYCIILEKSPNILVTAVMATHCCSARVPCLLGNAVTSLLLITMFFCPVSATHRMFSYEWKWKSKQENKVSYQNSISKDLKMWKYVTILAWKQPFSPAYSWYAAYIHIYTDVYIYTDIYMYIYTQVYIYTGIYIYLSDISHSNQYIAATNCRQVFLLLMFKINTCFELRTGLYLHQVSGLVSVELVADMYWSNHMVVGFVLLPMLAGDQNVAMGSPSHKNRWSFAAVVSFHFTVWLTFFLLDFLLFPLYVSHTESLRFQVAFWESFKINFSIYVRWPWVLVIKCAVGGGREKEKTSQ